MDKPKHTPGPWVLKDADQRLTRNIGVKQIGVGVTPICEIDLGNCDPSYPEYIAMANANLIAASPDLLEALKKWSVFMQDNYSPDDISWYQETLKAIAKAEGV